MEPAISKSHIIKPIYPAPVRTTAPPSFHRAWKDPALSASARYLPSFSAGLQGFFIKTQFASKPVIFGLMLWWFVPQDWETPISWDTWLMGYITDAWETPSQSYQSSHPPIIIPQVLKTHGARSGMSCGGHVMPSGERVTAAWGWTILTHNNQLSGRRVQFNWPITSLGPWFHVIIQSGGPILPSLIGFFFNIDVDEWLFKLFKFLGGYLDLTHAPKCRRQ